MDNKVKEWTALPAKDVQDYVKTTRDWWDNFLSENPDKLIKLNHQINARKQHLEELKADYNRGLGDPYTGEQVQVELLELIEALKEANNALRELFNKHSKNEDNSLDENVKQDDSSRIKEIAANIANKGSANYSAGCYEAFLKAYQNNELSVEKAREKALADTDSPVVKEELIDISSRNLYKLKDKL